MSDHPNDNPNHNTDPENVRQCDGSGQCGHTVPHPPHSYVDNVAAGSIANIMSATDAGGDAMDAPKSSQPGGFQDFRYAAERSENMPVSLRDPDLGLNYYTGNPTADNPAIQADIHGGFWNAGWRRAVRDAQEREDVREYHTGRRQAAADNHDLIEYEHEHMKADYNKEGYSMDQSGAWNTKWLATRAEGGTIEAADKAADEAARSTPLTQNAQLAAGRIRRDKPLYPMDVRRTDMWFNPITGNWERAPNVVANNDDYVMQAAKKQRRMG